MNAFHLSIHNNVQAHLHIYAPQMFDNLIVPHRCSNHFVDLGIGVHVILGLNGYIWISEPIQGPAQRTITGEHEDISEETPSPSPACPADVSAMSREKISRVRNCIVALSLSHTPIHPRSILETYEVTPFPSNWCHVFSFTQHSRSFSCFFP